MRALLAGFVLLTAPAMAAEPLTCPPSIVFTSQANVEPAQGWRPLPFPERRPLLGARLFDGDPSGMADLVPDKITPALTTWKLEPTMTYTFVCTYKDTELTFAAAVPKGAAQCTIAQKRFTTGAPPRGTYIEATCQ